MSKISLNSENMYSISIGNDEVELHNTVDIDFDGISCVEVYVNNDYVGEMRSESIPDIDDEEEVIKFEEKLIKFLNQNYY